MQWAFVVDFTLGSALPDQEAIDGAEMLIPAEQDCSGFHARGNDPYIVDCYGIAFSLGGILDQGKKFSGFHTHCSDSGFATTPSPRMRAV